MGKPTSLQSLARDCLNRGLAALKIGSHEEAVASLDGALALDPRMAPAYGARGIALGILGRHEAAIASFDGALALDPRLAATWSNRGNALTALGRYGEAIASFDRALALDPGRAGAWRNMAIALRCMDRHEEALASLDRALQIDPSAAAVWSDRGVALREMGRYSEALASFNQGVKGWPLDAQIRFNRGVLHLLLGNLHEGWDGWEWRQQLPSLGTPQPRAAGATWDGRTPLQGRTLLLLAEQGIGDTIQFCRYAPILAKRGARVALTVPAMLRGLLASLAGVEQLVGDADPSPAADLHCGLLSLPHRLGTTLDTIPASTPYLSAPPREVERWRQRLGPQYGRRIGLACSGNPKHAFDRHRSIPLSEFAPLAQLGCELHLLQNDLREQDGPLLGRLSIADHRADLNDLAEAAALTECMDAVVSVDTSIAHLAGALGRPLYLLLPAAPDWRWLLERDDSPWYPTARLFRQPAFGQWKQVLGRVCDALRVGSG